MLSRILLLLALAGVCHAQCSRQGYQCSGDQSVNCQCWSENRCNRRALGGDNDEYNDGIGRNDAGELRKSKSFSGGSKSSSSYGSKSSIFGGSSQSSCRTVQQCRESFRVSCDGNGCKDWTGQCFDDTEVCGTTWDGDLSGAFCNFKSDPHMPSNYISWKNHMGNTERKCSSIQGENCAQLGARNDGDWFVQNLQAFPRAEVICNPDNATDCMQGTIPAELIIGDDGSSPFFSNALETTFHVTDPEMLSAGAAADTTINVQEVTVIPSECPGFWNSFSCQRNIPECQTKAEGGGEAKPQRCYDTCYEVSRCLDAFLLRCVNLSFSDAGWGDCDEFDWNRTNGQTCNPGFSCQGIQVNTSLSARTLRNCKEPTEKCEARPYMLDGGYCSRGEDLKNLCEQFQQYPETRGESDSFKFETIHAIIIAVVVGGGILICALVFIVWKCFCRPKRVQPAPSPNDKLGGASTQPPAGSPTGFPPHQAFGGAPPPPSGLPPGWQQLHDASGRPYYCNPNTGATQWNMPGSGPSPQAWEQQGVTPTARGGPPPPSYANAAGQPPPPPPPPPAGAAGLPPGWVECKAATGATYYENHITKITQWERPMY